MCPYCDFNSFAGRDDEIDVTLGAIVAEARSRAAGIRPRTVFLGGGTPTHPSEAQLDRFLAGLLEAVGADPSSLDEFTVEANPGTLTPGKVRALRRHGVGRVSLGAQSFHDERLKVLGRIHDAGAIARGVEVLRDEGVPRVSLDLLLATPGQDLDEQRRDLERAVALAPEHVSADVLAYEEGPPFARARERGRLPGPDDDRDLAHLRLACETLAAAGYRRYEVSNHARPGEESLHNLGYWRNAEWIGLGPGAHSHVGGRRWKNLDDPARYAARVTARGEAEEWSERPDAPTALFESLMMGLRLAEGVDLDVLAARHGMDARVVHADALARHVADDTLVLEGPRLRCTDRGLDVLNAVLLDLVPEPIA
jgi:oxygen-independent coproporphyrinogen-3 oxidase